MAQIKATNNASLQMIQKHTQARLVRGVLGGESMQSNLCTQTKPNSPYRSSLWPGSLVQNHENSRDLYNW